MADKIRVAVQTEVGNVVIELSAQFAPEVLTRLFEVEPGDDESASVNRLSVRLAQSLAEMLPQATLKASQCLLDAMEFSLKQAKVSAGAVSYQNL